MDQTAMNELLHFLNDIGTSTLKLGENLSDFIQINFDAISDDALHRILQEAISVKKNAIDGSKASAWELILEKVHSITLNKRQNASNNIQQLIKLGQEGDLPRVEAFICSLVIKGQIDRLLCEILSKFSLIKINILAT